jgi:predicted MPP superfamily phosphohydrolase
MRIRIADRKDSPHSAIRNHFWRWQYSAIVLASLAEFWSDRAAVIHVREPIQSQVTRLFFHSFFRVLILVVSIAQWACLAWVLALLTASRWPWWSHLAGVGALHLLNRLLIARRRLGGARPPGLAFRAYTAVAFTSLFGFLFLVASGALWLIGGGIVGRLHAAAVGLNAAPIQEGMLADGFRWFVSTGMAGIGLLFAYGYVFGQRALRVVRRTLPLGSGAPPGAELRIAHISDIHIGQNLSLAELERFVASVNRIEPDLICITGDIIDSPNADESRFLPVLAQLRARYGVLATLGNHDHYTGASRVAAALRTHTPFRLLRDEAATLELGGIRLHVIGLDDRGRDWARGVLSDGQLARLLAAAPTGVPVLLLTHRPDVFPQAAEQGVLLTLAGHTHGGQLALPWFGGRRRNLAEFITAFSRGFYERDGSFLYVSCGLGVTGQRIRLFTPREIAVFDLVTSEE